MKTRFLQYYPYNSERSIDLSACLTSTKLKFNLDELTEYQDIDEENKLIYRE
jgi:hypothetical protein